MTELQSELAKFRPRYANIIDLCRTDVPATEAVREVRSRYPNAFASVAPPPAELDLAIQEAGRKPAEKWSGHIDRGIADCIRRIEQDRRIAEHHRALGIGLVS